MSDARLPTLDATERAAARRALAALYDALDARIAAERPHCALSGHCCDFPNAGHRLYATELEADIVAEAREIPEPEREGWCPFYRARRCELRDLRPTGCRVYYCDPTYTEAMATIGAWAHDALQRLHEETGLRYRYADFPTLLAAARER